MAPGRRVVVVGMGFIGSEVAASLRQKGLDVVAIEPGKTPLFRVLGERGAASPISIARTAFARSSKIRSLRSRGPGASEPSSRKGGCGSSAISPSPASA